ncbi:MAG: ribosome-associated translation inhibitor RaiA [Planctomycetes bacterium]|nr:ribosome-associated translation inhibitor RaiA [Planctomycetota bacterium]
MKVTLTVRHIKNLSSDFEKIAREKVSRLEKFFDRIHSAELVFDKQGDRIKGELIVSAVRGQMFIAEIEESNLSLATDSVIDKMERQMKKFNQRTKRKDRRSSVRSGRLIQEMMEAKTSMGYTDDEEEETYEDYIDKHGFESKK